MLPQTRPRVALVVWDVGERRRPSGYLFDLVRLGSGRFEFLVVSKGLAAELASFTAWRRVPAPCRWNRWAWAIFFFGAWFRLRGARADLVHAVGPAPMVPCRIDLASPLFYHADCHEACGGRPPSSLPGVWRLARWFAVALERRLYGPGRVRMSLPSRRAGSCCSNAGSPGSRSP